MSGSLVIIILISLRILLLPRNSSLYLAESVGISCCSVASSLWVLDIYQIADRVFIETYIKMKLGMTERDNLDLCGETEQKVG